MFCYFLFRFGSFEIFKPTDSMTGRKGPSEGRTDILIQLLDYTVQTFFPEVMTLTVELYLFFVIKIFFSVSSYCSWAILKMFELCKMQVINGIIIIVLVIISSHHWFHIHCCIIFIITPCTTVINSLLSLFLFCIAALISG